MRLFLRYRDLLKKLSELLVAELEQMVERINAWAHTEHRGDGTHGEITVQGLDLRAGTQLTVGAAGSGSALPATPTGYALIKIDGTTYVVPYYAQS